MKKTTVIAILFVGLIVTTSQLHAQDIEKPLEQRPHRSIMDPIAKPPLPDKPLLLVANKHSDTLTYIDPESLEILDTIPTGPNPHEIVITPDQRYSGISKVISCRRCSLSNGIRISIRPSPVVARPSFR